MLKIVLNDIPTGKGVLLTGRIIYRTELCAKIFKMYKF